MAECLPGEQDNAYGYGCVCNIEGWPIMVPGMKLQKIDNIPVSNAIEQISQCTGENQPERHLQQSVVGRIAQTENNYSHGGDRGHEAQHNHFERRTQRIQNSEGNSRVLYIRYVESPVYYRDRLSQIKVQPNCCLGYTINQ